MSLSPLIENWWEVERDSAKQEAGIGGKLKKKSLQVYLNYSFSLLFP